jgi:hypothetical protein
LFTKQEGGEAIVKRLQIVVSDLLINGNPILQYQLVEEITLDMENNKTTKVL